MDKQNSTDSMVLIVVPMMLILAQLIPNATNTSAVFNHKGRSAKVLIEYARNERKTDLF